MLLSGKRTGLLKTKILFISLLFINKRLIRIDITKTEYSEAKNLSQMRKIPFVDCLNAIQARNHKAIMVRHIYDFLLINSSMPTISKML